jgi:hypothetical protein
MIVLRHILAALCEIPSAATIMSDGWVEEGSLHGFWFSDNDLYRLCGLVARVSAIRSSGPVSIPGATRFSEK